MALDVGGLLGLAVVYNGLKRGGGEDWSSVFPLYIKTLWGEGSWVLPLYIMALGRGSWV